MILAKFKMSQNYSFFMLLERTENEHGRESLETDGEKPLLFGIYRKLCHISFSMFPFTR